MRNLTKKQIAKIYDTHNIQMGISLESFIKLINEINKPLVKEYNELENKYMNLYYENLI